jgi:hypothetical protein
MTEETDEKYLRMIIACPKESNAMYETCTMCLSRFKYSNETLRKYFPYFLKIKEYEATRKFVTYPTSHKGDVYMRLCRLNIPTFSDKCEYLSTLNSILDLK